jgi:nucleoside-diphosphate-sugar epimerase
MKNMLTEKILVTGAAGFTGGNLTRRLAADGHMVRAFVREPALCTDLTNLGVEVVKGDLRDSDSVRAAMSGVDLVYHIGALFRPENVSRQDMWDVNVQGTKNMLDAAEEAGVRRFVHCSTIGVHGDVENPPANEESPYAPKDYYQESKTEGEQLVRRYMDEHRLPVSIFRPAGIYGPGDLRFLKLVKPIKNGRFVMIGSGKTRFHMVYIDDLVDGILLCGTKPQALGQIYILAGCDPVALNDLVKMVADILHVPPPRWRIPYAPVFMAGHLCELVFKPLGIHPPLYRRRVSFFKNTRWFDITKAQQELGFNPKIDVRCGIERTARWYQQEGVL